MIRRILLGSLLLLSCFAFAQSKRPFTLDDMMQLKRVGDFVVSPDGRWVAFTAVDVSLTDNSRKPHLWVVPVAGGESRRLTTAGGPGEDRLRFAPDGRSVLFVSARDGGSQVWVHQFDSVNGVLMGEPRKVTSISTEASGATWSPDGKWILFTSDVYPDCPDDACNKGKEDEREKSRVKATVYEHLFYRHWSSYFGGKRSHLFLVPAEGGVARDLVPGDHDVPPFSLGGQDQYAFSPDGKEIAFTGNIEEVQATSTNSDVFVLSLTEQGAKPRNLTAENKGSDSTAMYSPDGKWLAIRSQFRAGYESDRFRLRLIERATGKITNLTEGFDRWVDSMAWAPDSKKLYITAGDKGESPLYAVDISGGTPVEVVRGSNDSPAPTPNGKTIIFGRNSVQYPTELFAVQVDPAGGKASGKDAQLTSVNREVFSAVSMQPVEPFWFTGSEKAKVQGFIVKPPNFDAAKKYPVKFLIHGGPQGAWGDDWSFRWNPNMFASDGYVVVMVNPRGSTGYGQKFVDDVNGDWGGRAYKDLMMGLDYAEKTYPYIDKDRECAMGASYGGYMVNWILGHNTRFKCLVSHDGMFNTESAYGSTEELWFPEWELKGTPWNNRATYVKWSPHQYAKNFKTPTLVVHGQLDYRLDVSEGFQLFTTLQRLGVPSKMLYFPDEGHWVLKPQNSQLWYKTVNGWVDSYLQGANVGRQTSDSKR
ncbi:MAG TPA: S9 family peptidase [Clostridia bacterium]|nr:S9 family peptidase [Clostridia bacterium]